MSDEKTYLKIYLLKKAWSVEVPENVWKEVSEWCKKHRRCYSVQEKYHRIWVRTLGHLIDLIGKTSEVS